MAKEVHCCRFCDTPLTHEVIDLGMSPLCENYVPQERANEMEPFYPLDVKVCEKCDLVQLDQYVAPEQIFSEYAYFSSYSDAWLKHAAQYADMIVERLGLGSRSRVVELGSNDGYLLQNFVRKGIPCLGVEPAANIARAAEQLGVRTRVDFFGAETARRMRGEGLSADLIIGNNVLAQVPDLNGFVEGIRILLKPEGVATLEFPHLHRLIEECQYDTIYHEHFCYFSWISAEQIFMAHGLRLFDVEKLPTHGGSLRIYACHADDAAKQNTAAVEKLRRQEQAAGYDRMTVYETFGERVRESKRTLLTFLIDARRNGRTVAGYGAPGKGNTLLNYCGIRTDLLDFTVDRNPYKHGRLLPGTHIPIYPVERIDAVKPDYLLILPWNLKEEIMEQMAHVREWGCKFVVPIPLATVFN